MTRCSAAECLLYNKYSFHVDESHEDYHPPVASVYAESYFVDADYGQRIVDAAFAADHEMDVGQVAMVAMAGG